MQRRFVTSIRVFRIIEDREQTKKIFLGDRIVLVIVTLGTRHRRPHPDCCGRVHSVNNGDVTEFFVVRTTFVVGHRISMKGGRDQLVVGRVRQQVTRKLLDRELIERLIGIKRFHHIIAEQPDAARRVIGIARRVGISGQIEPQQSPMLTESWLGQNTIHQLFISLRISIVHEGIDFCD